MRLFETDENSSAPRIEYKYFVPAWVRTPLLNDLSLFCEDDPHSAGLPNGYTVSSIYYDNLAFKAYHDKLDGADERFKLRVRFYPDGNGDSAAWLRVEMKYKQADRIMKGQVRMGRQQFAQVLRGDFTDVPYHTDTTLNHYYRMVKVNGFRPAYRVDYRRKAFFARNDSKVRVTLDNDVFCDRFSEYADERPCLPVTPQGLGILEIKSPGHMPFWLTRILEKYRLSRSAISKYAAAVRSVARNSAPAYA